MEIFCVWDAMLFRRPQYETKYLKVRWRNPITVVAQAPKY
jgi:hypothetical protein